MPDRYGFTAVSNEFIKAIAPTSATPTPLKDIILPQTSTCKALTRYATDNLSKETLNHSIRVFLYTRAIMKDYLPHTSLGEDVVYAACLLHDIGTTEENIKASKMSFEYYGGMIAHSLVFKESGGELDYADAVAEAVFRHQNLGDEGQITLLGLLIQISTILDNVGRPDVLQYVHPETLKLVNESYSRDGWLSCFAEVIDKELSLKPWAHTSAIPAFKEKVLSNKLDYLNK